MSVDIRDILYSQEKSPLDFKFDSLQAKPLHYYIPDYNDILRLNYIATSVKYASKIELKYKEIEKVMRKNGFRKFHAGTNRVVYVPYNDNTVVAKIAVDEVGIKDNPAEMNNQQHLKPFVTKVFDMSPCGVIAITERVHPILTKEEFIMVAEDVYDLLVNKIIGKYVLEDIGSKYFMNFGIRSSFGVVLLDYPYMYELDGKKLYCNKEINSFTHEHCGGTIDYDIGFNNLICTKCGKLYLAQQLEQDTEHKKIIIKGANEMKWERVINGQTVSSHNEEHRSIQPAKTVVKKESKSIPFTIEFSKNSSIENLITDKEKEKIEEVRKYNQEVSKELDDEMKNYIDTNSARKCVSMKEVSINNSNTINTKNEPTEYRIKSFESIFDIFNSESSRYRIGDKIFVDDGMSCTYKVINTPVKSPDDLEYIEEDHSELLQPGEIGYGLSDKDFEEPDPSIADKY